MDILKRSRQIMTTYDSRPTVEQFVQDHAEDAERHLAAEFPHASPMEIQMTIRTAGVCEFGRRARSN